MLHTVDVFPLNQFLWNSASHCTNYLPRTEVSVKLEEGQRFISATLSCERLSQEPVRLMRDV